MRCNPRTTCKVKLQAQAYSIRDCHARRLLTKEGGIRRPVIDLFPPFWWWTDIIKSGSPQVSCIPRRTGVGRGGQCLHLPCSWASQTDGVELWWSLGSGLAAKTVEGLGNKAQQCESGPICLALCWVWSEFCCPKRDFTRTLCFQFGGHPFRKRLRITHHATGWQ